MKILKLQEQFDTPAKEEFIMQEAAVQGAKIGKKDGALLIVSSRRYKLFTTGMDRVKIVKGDGFFKWKRGEVKFFEGDCFEIDEVGEYEINGKGVYVVVRN